MPQFVINRVKENDLEACAQVIRTGFATVAKEFGLTPRNCPTNGAFMPTKRLKKDFDNKSLLYALSSKDCIVGFMQLEKKKGGRFVLKNLAVLPEYRHCGLGHMLLDFAAGKVRRLGGKAISIGIIEENTVLKKWYSDNGFIHMGTKTFDHLPFTVGFMEKPIGR